MHRSRAGLGRPRARLVARGAGAAEPPGTVPIFALSENGTVPFDDAETRRCTSGPKRLFRLDGPHRGGPRLVTFQLGRNRLALPERADEDRRLIDERLADLAESFDLAEPFQRIRDAIEEAQQAVR